MHFGECEFHSSVIPYWGATSGICRVTAVTVTPPLCLICKAL
jgi:hypothetical protein